jgi:hypothetical protein
VLRGSDPGTSMTSSVSGGFKGGWSGATDLVDSSDTISLIKRSSNSAPLLTELSVSAASY